MLFYLVTIFTYSELQLIGSQPSRPKKNLLHIQVMFVCSGFNFSIASLMKSTNIFLWQFLWKNYSQNRWKLSSETFCLQKLLFNFSTITTWTWITCLSVHVSFSTQKRTWLFHRDEHKNWFLFAISWDRLLDYECCLWFLVTLQLFRCCILNKAITGQLNITIITSFLCTKTTMR